MDKEKPTITKKTWDEFKSTGLFWWINMILHTFGWDIVIEYDKDGKFTSAYPARTIFRGFDGNTNDRGYRYVTEYMKNNAEELLSECEVESDDVAPQSTQKKKRSYTRRKKVEEKPVDTKS